MEISDQQDVSQDQQKKLNEIEIQKARFCLDSATDAFSKLLIRKFNIGRKFQA